MRLIGSKLKLTKFIEEGINSLLKENNEDKKSFILADIFAGSGAVGKFFKEKNLKLFLMICNIIVILQITIY